MKEIKNPYLDIPNEMYKENNTKDCYEHRKRDLTCAHRQFLSIRTGIW